VTQQGFSAHALERTLFVMEKREIIRFSGQVSFERFVWGRSGRGEELTRAFDLSRFTEKSHSSCWCLDLAFSFLSLVSTLCSAFALSPSLVVLVLSPPFTFFSLGFASVSLLSSAFSPRACFPLSTAWKPVSFPSVFLSHRCLLYPVSFEIVRSLPRST